MHFFESQPKNTSQYKCCSPLRCCISFVMKWAVGANTQCISPTQKALIIQHKNTQKFEWTSPTLHVELRRHMSLPPLLPLLLFLSPYETISALSSALLCFKKFSLVQWAVLHLLLCSAAFRFVLFLTLCDQQLDFPLRILTSTKASPNCCGLSAHQPPSVLEKRPCL